MKIGIAGPVSTECVAKYLKGDISSLPTGYPGAPFLGTIITTLIERGHEVSAYTIDRTLPDIDRAPIVVAGDKFKIHYIPWRRHSFRPNGLRPGYMLDFFSAERRALTETIKLDRPDIVHAHWTYEFALAAIASGRPHLVTSHDSPVQVLKHMPNAYRLGRYFMARRVFEKAKALTAVSPYLRDEIARYARVPVTVIPNPLPPTLLQRNASSGANKAALNKPRIAMVLNGWQRIKNPEPALYGFHLLLQRFPEATLHLYGYDYGAGEKAERWATSRGLKHGIVFHGLIPHDNLMRELCAMHLLLHPALEETFGMALVEAMALGIPVVAGSKSGAVPWILDDGAAGVLTDVRSAKKISEALIHVFASPDLHTKYAAAALRRVYGAFNPDIVTDRYEEQYRWIKKHQREE